MLPQAIPQPATQATHRRDRERRQDPDRRGYGGLSRLRCHTPGRLSLRPSRVEKIVELTFAADRNQLFTAWNAIANLADLAGKVTVTIRAESEKGFDKAKLQNGVLEPLLRSGSH